MICTASYVMSNNIIISAPPEPRIHSFIPHQLALCTPGSSFASALTRNWYCSNHQLSARDHEMTIVQHTRLNPNFVMTPIIRFSSAMNDPERLQRSTMTVSLTSSSARLDAAIVHSSQPSFSVVESVKTELSFMSHGRGEGCVSSDKEVGATLNLELFGRFALALITESAEESTVDVAKVTADDSDTAHPGSDRGEDGRKGRMVGKDSKERGKILLSLPYIGRRVDAYI